MDDKKGLVTNIQRFSIHDGPGIRTTIFLKGCPNRCFWCHNPEGLKSKIELEYSADKCFACGRCVNVCRFDALKLVEDKLVINRLKCTNCLECIDVCLVGALKHSARELTVREVMEEVTEDFNAYKDSGGGITLSGGEPLAQPEFSLALLKEAKNKNINTTIETSANVSWKVISKVLPYTDLFMIDIKLINDKK